jgi:HAE1 family hydrophobic/amphiphilic exporter-1
VPPQLDHSVNVRGRDYAEIGKATDEIVAWMKTQKGYVDIDTSYRGGKPELTVNIDRDRAADLGVPVASIAMTVRNLMANDKISELTVDGDRYDVRMKLDEKFRQHPEDLASVRFVPVPASWSYVERGQHRARHGSG